MAVLNNLVQSNAITKDEIVTIDRPVKIGFEYTGSGDDIPVICEVQAWGFFNGAYSKLGLPLYANRVSSTTQASPKFEIDFAEIIGRRLDNTFKKTMGGVTTWPQAVEANALVDQENKVTNADGEGATKVKFDAVAWCVNSLGFLERSDEDVVIWTDDYFIYPTRITLPENFINGDSFSNLLDVNDDTFKGVCQPDIIQANADLSRFPTSCPRNLERTIHKDWGVPLGLITYNQHASTNINVSFEGTITATSTAESYDTVLNSLGEECAFKTLLYPINLFIPNLASASSVDDVDSKVKFNLDVTNTDDCDSLIFNWVKTVKPNSKAIYWINDYNCLDYYLFDGGISINYKNEVSTYIKNRDYKNTRDASRNVMSGKTTETVNVFSQALNKEALIWLQEIGRSRRVYEYNHDENQSFIPITIESFDTVVLDSVSRDAVSVEIQYKRSLIATR